jgi:hypothetical protein
MYFSSMSKSNYDLRFSAHQSVFTTSTLRPRTGDFFLLNSCGHNLHKTSSLTRRRHGSHRKHRFYHCVFSRCQGNNVPEELFPINGCCTVTCFHSCYLAKGLHVTTCSNEADEFHSESCKESDKL